MGAGRAAHQRCIRRSSNARHTSETRKEIDAPHLRRSVTNSRTKGVSAFQQVDGMVRRSVHVRRQRRVMFNML